MPISRFLPARLTGGSSSGTSGTTTVTTTAIVPVGTVVGPTVATILDSARVRHWSFTERALGDGALVLYLNQRVRTHLAAHGASIEALVGTSLQYALISTSASRLIAYQNGVPVTATTYQDGYAIHFTTDGVPYTDSSELPIAGDPFGANGGVPGFPLPVDMVRLISVGLIYGDATTGYPVACDLIPERERFTRQPGRNPAAFVSGNRLVPALPGAVSVAGDRWHQVSALTISYVAVPTLSALTDVVPLPSVLCEALVADVALMLARQSEKCPPADKAAFAADAAAASAAVARAALDELDSAQSSSVLYRP